MGEKKLESQIKEFSDLAKQDPNIDVASLMLSALKNENQNKVPPERKKWAYIISLVAPPFGLLYALKFYFSDEEDARGVANTCVILTLFSAVLFWVAFKTILSGSGSSLDKIQQIKPSDVYELGQ